MTISFGPFSFRPTLRRENGGWHMRRISRLVRVSCALLCALLLAGCAGLPGGKPAGGSEPVAITVWHYYNGAQQKMFEQLVDDFNLTAGAQSGIVVEAHSFGKVGDLTTKVLDAIYKKVGAQEVPDIFAAYADTAYEINQAGMVADIAQYLTPEEQARYVDSYLDEGRFDSEGFKIFPVAKSTELLCVNKTQWDAFSAATGASEEELATWEGIARLSEAYYRWTDSLTPDVAEDGRAFFGRDAFANYIIIGSLQLGSELFHVEDGAVKLQVDGAIMRRLWDNYYVPYINGYYAATGNFRSDDLRTGVVAAYVGATSGATYFPTEVTDDAGDSSPIQGMVRALPNFEGTQPMAVQQGAGMVVSKSTPERERAAATFLKWMTEPEQNVRFAVASGYLPVTWEANDSEAVLQAARDMGQTLTPVLEESLKLGVSTTQDYTLYTSRPFARGYETRQVAETAMSEQAKADREAVLALMAEGVPREEAVARYDTNENFEAWLAAFTQALTDAAQDG